MAKIEYDDKTYEKVLSIIRSGCSNKRKDVADNFNVTLSVASGMIARALIWEEQGGVKRDSWYKLSTRARNTLLIHFGNRERATPQNIKNMTIETLINIRECGEKTWIEILHYAADD